MEVAGGIEPRGIHPTILCREFRRLLWGQQPYKEHTMPSNNPNYQKEYLKKHYANNKDYYKSKAKARNKRVRQQLYKFVNRYKTFVGCVDCGYKSNPVALQFDHVRGEKTMAVSTMVSRATSIGRVKEEMRKCEVRCANCHAVVTKSRRDLS